MICRNLAYSEGLEDFGQSRQAHSTSSIDRDSCRDHEANAVGEEGTEL